MRLILVIALSTFTSGCAGSFSAWYAAHQTTVVGVAAVGGAVYAVEHATNEAITLGERVTEKAGKK